MSSQDSEVKNGINDDTVHVNEAEYEDVDFIQEDVQSGVSKPLWVLIVATIMSSTFLFSLDNTIIADVQPKIVEVLGDVGKLSWLGVAFVLASSSTLITWAKLYGIFSAKWLYIGSVILFEGGSALCGGAPTMNAMIVGRAIAGLGGAGMYIGCLTLLSLTTSVRQRPNYMAFVGLTWGSGTVLGPVVGGAFSENAKTTWRWAFYINLCIGAAFAPIYFWFLPRGDPQKTIPFAAKFKQLDYLGIALNIGAFTALIMAINFGGNLYAWNDGREIALWTVGGFLLLLFGLQQAFKIGTTFEQRIFPADFLRMKIMWVLFALMNAAATCVFFVRGDPPLTAAVRLLPFICLMVFFGLLNGALMSNFGYYMPWYLLGGIFTTIGGALMYTVTEASSNSQLYGYSIIIGIGAGMFIQTSFSVAQAKVSKDRASDAAGYIALAQNLGIVLSLAISGSIFQNKALDGLQSILPNVPTEALRGVITGSGSALFNNLPLETKAQVLDAILKAMSYTYVLVIVAGSMAIIGSLFMKLERIFVTGAVAM
ncbi:hypothetical protein G7Y89_g2452 [Cudoniella acicularis]|uniref:Major facilitator superfamily (MFS) profile domain-containing protein n=1 Tax=Cudoniella acicularis TaxID=354080 RepID=A0A8H4W639_9HELO|nr:hypothetical protein G7Y89_g2452 [Cudoniella acicularis]